MMKAASSSLGRKDDPKSAFTLLEKMETCPWGQSILNRNPDIRKEFEALRENMQAISIYNQEAIKLLRSLSPEEIKLHYKHSGSKPEVYAKHCPQLAKVTTYIQDLQVQVKDKIGQAPTVEEKIKLFSKYEKLIEGLIQNKNFLAANALANGLKMAHSFHNEYLIKTMPTDEPIKQLKSTIRLEQYKDLNQGIPDPVTLLSSAIQMSATIDEAQLKYTVAEQKLYFLQLRKANKLDDHIANLERERDEIIKKKEALAVQPNKEAEVTKLNFALADKKNEILNAQEVKKLSSENLNKQELEWKQMSDPERLKQLIEVQQAQITAMEKALLKEA